MMVGVVVGGGGGWLLVNWWCGGGKIFVLTSLKMFKTFVYVIAVGNTLRPRF